MHLLAIHTLPRTLDRTLLRIRGSPPMPHYKLLRHDS